MPSPRIEVPSEIVQKWQEIVNLLAEIIQVPAALVMKFEPPNINVFVSSESSGNPYEKDEVACFDPGLYCERVIKSQQQLLVPDALQDEEWKSNPDVKLGMISYLGFPIAWPDGHIFGTICVLDDKRNAYSEPYRKFLLQCRDVLQTDLKLLTSAMREGEERFRLVADAAPVLIWMSGPDKLCNYFNQPWLEFTGRPIELELGNGWAEGVHPEDLERCLDTYTKAFDGRESFKMDYRLRRHDREYRWVLDTGVPRFNRDDSFAGYIGSCIDITERKRAEERLREFEKVVEVLGDRIIVVDREYRYVMANAAFLNYRGFEKEQVIGHTVAEILGKETFETHIKEQFDECFQGKVVQHEVKYTYPKLGARNISASYFPIRGPLGIDRIACVLRDITERTRAEEAVRESEERFRLVANNAPVMIWTSGLDKKPTYFNQLWLDFTGLSETDLRNGLAGIVHPEDYVQCHDVYCRGFDQQQPFRKECRLRRHDGQYRWMLDVGVPRFHKDGSFAGYIGSCIDVTERKMVEEAWAGLSGRLIDAQEDERKRIAREIHDDYTQQLAVLSIDLEGLAEEVGDFPVGAGQKFHRIWNQISELGADLHSLSHRLHSSTLESLGLVAGVKAFCQEFAYQNELQVDFIQGNVPSGIPAEVALCLFRITQEGLRNIKRHSGAERAEVHLEVSGEDLHLSVVDRGKGFDVNKLSTRDGIGLRSMEERLRSLGGHLEINSRPTQGTRVDAWLPLRFASRV